MRYKKSKLKRQDLFISDKIDGLQMHELNGQIEKHVDASLKKITYELFGFIINSLAL